MQDLERDRARGRYPKSRYQQTGNPAMFYHYKGYNGPPSLMRLFRIAFAEIASCGIGRNRRYGFDQPCHLPLVVSPFACSRQALPFAWWSQMDRLLIPVE